MNIRKYFNPDKIVGTSAFIISLGTFLALVYQTKLSQEQAELTREQFVISQQQFVITQEQAQLNRQALYATMLPYLEMYNSHEAGIYSLILENNGLGPAFIQKVSVNYKGKFYPGDQASFLTTVPKLEERPGGYTYTNISNGSVIPAGKKITLVVAHNSGESSIKLKRFFEKQSATNKEAAKIIITYRSIYEEAWRLEGMEPPKKIKPASN
ncbi:hypothetical protein Q0590_28425 [Rhodocytophaga aerolata]|uniref:Uncharacterized protein n=1 Tax=Rhodocytophaga aerolata TaxID=455078 RepID=A0ABT8RDW6_9BACT|nr:hypothetical protein [Rhodocytophaga aerolata]MDO1450240.1 hypothetical protein [Rhodocytophaga aerolata]